jgi:hypothetical protein
MQKQRSTTQEIQHLEELLQGCNARIQQRMDIPESRRAPGVNEQIAEYSNYKVQLEEIIADLKMQARIEAHKKAEADRQAQYDKEYAELELLVSKFCRIMEIYGYRGTVRVKGRGFFSKWGKGWVISGASGYRLINGTSVPDSSYEVLFPDGEIYTCKYVGAGGDPDSVLNIWIDTPQPLIRYRTDIERFIPEILVKYGIDWRASLVKLDKQRKHR